MTIFVENRSKCHFTLFKAPLPGTSSDEGANRHKDHFHNGGKKI